MKLMLMTVAAGLAGCSSSPKDVMETGDHQNGTIAKPPLDAARCIARSAETIVRGTTELTTTLSVWRFKRSSTGADYDVWVTRDLLAPAATHIKLVRGDC